MTELPEKVREWLDSRAHETTQGRMWPYLSRREVEEVARLAIEEATREKDREIAELRRVLAEGNAILAALRGEREYAMSQAAELRERLERALRCLEDHAGLVWHRPEVALAIREAKEAK